MKTHWIFNRTALTTHRTKKGLSPEQVGECINVTDQTIRNWESGFRVPKADAVSDLANLFRTSPLAFYMLVPVGRTPRLVKGGRQQ